MYVYVTMKIAFGYGFVLPICLISPNRTITRSSRAKDRNLESVFALLRVGRDVFYKFCYIRSMKCHAIFTTQWYRGSDGIVIRRKNSWLIRVHADFFLRSSYIDAGNARYVRELRACRQNRWKVTIYLSHVAVVIAHVCNDMFLPTLHQSYQLRLQIET